MVFSIPSFHALSKWASETGGPKIFSYKYIFKQKLLAYYTEERNPNSNIPPAVFQETLYHCGHGRSEFIILGHTIVCGVLYMKFWSVKTTLNTTQIFFIPVRNSSY
jgi:hypothetical protein